MRILLQHFFVFTDTPNPFSSKQVQEEFYIPSLLPTIDYRKSSSRLTQLVEVSKKIIRKFGIKKKESILDEVPFLRVNKKLEVHRVFKREFGEYASLVLAAI